MMVVVGATVAVLVVAAVLGLVRLYTATDDASVAAVSDLLYFCAVGIVVKEPAEIAPATAARGKITGAG